MKTLKEWSIQAPWGKIALKSWGNPNGEPVLLVHGRQDSLATFEPLLKLLPDTYHYVALDQPGHGRSDGFPKGMNIQRAVFVVAVELVVAHLGWQQFIYIGHSMASELGLLFNVANPNRIQKMVLLDPGPSFQYLVGYNPKWNFEDLFANYYDNYKFYNEEPVYSRDGAIKVIMKNRQMTEDQAEVVLSRNLIKVGEDRYKLSWDRRLKAMYPLQNTLEYQKEVFTKNLPPLLIVACTDSQNKIVLKDTSEWDELLNYIGEHKNCTIIKFKGDHDLHFKNPEVLIKDITDFLKKKTVASKL